MLILSLLLLLLLLKSSTVFTSRLNHQRAYYKTSPTTLKKARTYTHIHTISQEQGQLPLYFSTNN